MKTPPRRRLTAFVCLALLVAAPLGSAEKKPSDITIDWGSAPPPGKIDPQYTPEGLTAAFRTLCRRLGYPIKSLAIDQTEFPYLVYGTLDGRCYHLEFRDALAKMPGYAYSGSATEITRAGITHFALNMTPAALYSRDRIRPAPRESIIDRLEKLRDAARKLRR